MNFDMILGILVWTGVGALLLFVLMFVDSLFTKYKDLEEVKAGNMAVTTRLIMKLVAQGYILSVSIGTSAHLLEAIVVSIVSFVILLILEALAEQMLRLLGGINLDKGTQEGKTGYGLFAGTLHVVGALIITACL
ncbi:Uncharacterized membrane protein YjfL, UPF0719 family [Paenibacillus uliginis N3/975]|uniref:Uncharacterized membrane protein YjfL, UPF0719 family n=1 Tax=Paenibacillus uliginis N3/975 TaxID=1313296 RepID=A0A1X7HH01_9BACL|nr:MULTISPECIES: DUF350 domain-containing protein [Paenibacillus]UNK20894.1 DUF350 domain-containing protein [Paenibacillus sp. N3/727]SMF86210.1 Uncharacterized membrane protein YjfL, UPF0719 family [Paenibacillus uliginis N3/975]